MGLFDREAAQFNPSFGGFAGDVGAVRSARDTPINSLSSAGGAEMGLLNQDRRRALDDLRSAQAGRLGTSQNQLALSGGLSSGASERLAGSSDRQGGMFAQETIGDFARAGAGVRAGDFGRQQAVQNQALFAAPGLGQGLDQINAQIQAANLQAQAAENERRSGLFSGLLGAAGTVVGGIYGGPVGGAAGGAAGNAIGGLFG